MEKNNNLKEFQKATVESIIDRFKAGQNRVLVADEVGLGKTLIARGVIEEAYKEFKSLNKCFNVVYICSNGSIANQNVHKLADEDIALKPTNERLSMQSLNLFRLKKNKKMQIIALTPSTSFFINNKRGCKEERALICATLCKIEEFKKYSDKLRNILVYNAEHSFDGLIDYYTNIINDSNGYIEKLIELGLLNDISKISINGKSLYELLNEQYLEPSLEGEIIRNLRIIFSNIGLRMIEADLVIMDEFQRFNDLIIENGKTSEKENETRLLVNYFKTKTDLKILLLSATPYKLYVTQEEIAKAAEEEQKENYNQYYKEFLNVMQFLLKDNFKEFEDIWLKHSQGLDTVTKDNFACVLAIKNNAEEAMYQAISRTERNYLINPKQKENKLTTRTILNPDANDIKSYIQMARIVNEMKKEKEYSRAILLVDYVKSCPYVLSFANSYKIKVQMKKYLSLQKHKKYLSSKQLMYLNKEDIEKYNFNENILKSNSKLKVVNDIIFKKDNKDIHLERLLWLPPTKPYYEGDKPFNKKENLTKTIIFSKWEMVPRMLSTLLSFEVESKNNKGTMIYKKEKSQYQQLEYFDINKPAGRIEDRFTTRFLLMYPSQKLSKQYNPIADINKPKEQLKREIKEKIINLYNNPEGKFKVEDKATIDKRLYYLIPLLLDDKDYVEKWIDSIKEISPNMASEIKKLYENENYKTKPLGLLSDDIINILVNYIIASPANCIYRNLDAQNTNNDLEVEKINCEYTAKISSNFVRLFNSPEATAILDKCYGAKSQKTYWKKVLQYCFAGNLQAVIDEYFYMIVESNCLDSDDRRNKRICDIVSDAMTINTARYSVDMLVKTDNKIKIEPEVMRGHFAMGFSQGDRDSEITVDANNIYKETRNRKESIRSAFNSPFWPFVLTSTSIGQEGLDFHYYCRRVIHWNLPANPIDIEQREGRIDRYKSLAIRKYIAEQNTNQSFRNNIWKEMFENVEEKVKSDNKGGLIPCWCLPDEQKLEIERIIPLYSFSEEVGKYKKQVNILETYRITLGQERQEELLTQISNLDNEQRRELFINLCPWSKKEDWHKIDMTKNSKKITGTKSIK